MYLRLRPCTKPGGVRYNKAETMNFTIQKSIEILERTPNVLLTMLENISADWTSINEGGDTWSVYDIIGHLIHGEKTDWIPRTFANKPETELLVAVTAGNASRLWI